MNFWEELTTLKSQIADLCSRLASLESQPGNYSVLADRLITVPGAPFTLVTINQLSSLGGIIDFSELKHGDTVEISILSGIHRDSMKPYRRQVFHGPLTEPIIIIPERSSPAFSIELKQTTGQARGISYSLLWRYLGG